MTKTIPIECSNDTYLNVLCSFNGTHYAEMLGFQFYVRLNNCFIVCDNTDGKAESSCFDSFDECLKWFEGHESYNENEIMLLGEHLMNR